MARSLRRKEKLRGLFRLPGGEQERFPAGARAVQ